LKYLFWLFVISIFFQTYLYAQKNAYSVRDIYKNLKQRNSCEETRLNSNQASLEDNLLRDFKNPPSGYGPLPFYWWTGEKLSVQRIAEQLEQMKEAGFSGVCVDYTHTIAGYQYRSNPAFFSDEWWSLWEKVVDECAKRNMSIGLDDYLITHGSSEYAAVGSKIYKEEPKISGLLLRQKNEIISGCTSYSLKQLIDSNIIDAVAYKMIEGKPDSKNYINLLSLLKSGDAVWAVPVNDWYISILYTEIQPYGEMNPLYSEKVIEYYFDKFEKHSKGQLGKAINFFHQDELTFGGSMPYWSKKLPDEFRKIKGYDIIPELTALFTDLGDKTVKIRLDYYDIATKMMEDAYFKPIFEWCNKRNIIYAHDQCSRADVIEGVKLYGDYFRTLKWYSAPGTDRMPELNRGKVVASICQLYNRPRAWLEGYHSEGWGVKPADIARWDFEALIYGYNLLNYHSCYYTTLGGWWEWAPGDITFRQPYFPFLNNHYNQVKRLCYLLSRGKHKCDVAILFPSSVVQADMEGTKSGKYSEESKQLLNITEKLFKEYSIDFDFIDDESIWKSYIENASLKVEGGAYKVLILPAIRFIRNETLEKVFEFYQSGGKVIAISAVPEADDSSGSNNILLDKTIKEIFGHSASDLYLSEYDTIINKNKNGGAGCFLKNGFYENRIADFISNSIQRDFISDSSKIQVMHRKIDKRDIYALYNPYKNLTRAKLTFNIQGKIPEEWDSKNGNTRPIPVKKISKNSIELEIDFLPNELKVVAFRNGIPNTSEIAKNIQTKNIDTIILDNEWNIKLNPVLNNKWGDFCSPASDNLIGAETRKFRYKEEHENANTNEWYKPDYDDNSWKEVVRSYGPRIWLLGPINPNEDLIDLEKKLVQIKNISPSDTFVIGGQKLLWIQQDYSLRWGMYNDPVLTNQTGYAIHGAIGYVPNEVIHIKSAIDGEIWYAWTSIYENKSTNLKLAAGSRAGFDIWFNGKRIMSKSEIKPEKHERPWNLSYYPYAIQTESVNVHGGNNVICLKLKTSSANTYSRVFLAVGDSLKEKPEPVITEDPAGNADFVPTGFVASELYGKKGIRTFDCYPDFPPKAMWYRFKTPPGMKSMTINAHGSIKIWIDGKEMSITEDSKSNSPARQNEGAQIYTLSLNNSIPFSRIAVLRIEPEKGYYSGAALPEPVRYVTDSGKIILSDWAEIGLESYSGAVNYSRRIFLNKKSLNRKFLLDLGDLNAAAKIMINGKEVGVVIEPPWQFDISDYIKEGENLFEISIVNTLANHYSIGMPCGKRYIKPGQTKSGLLGPVRILIMNPK
jgi:hypothetical protein